MQKWSAKSRDDILVESLGLVAANLNPLRDQRRLSGTAVTSLEQRQA